MDFTKVVNFQYYVLRLADSAYLPYTEAGTDKAAAACILTLKLGESRSSSKRILKSDETLAKQQTNIMIKISMAFSK